MKFMKKRNYEGSLRKVWSDDNTQRLGRELMTMDELTTMPGDKCILQLRRLRPFFSPKYDLKQHPNYRYTAEADKRNSSAEYRLFAVSG